MTKYKYNNIDVTVYYSSDTPSYLSITINYRRIIVFELDNLSSPIKFPKIQKKKRNTTGQRGVVVVVETRRNAVEMRAAPAVAPLLRRK